MLIPLGMAEWCVPFWVTLTLTLTSGLISMFKCLEHISFITANFPQMCLMLDQFLWGHSSLCEPGRVAQSVTCLVIDAKLTADPGVTSSIPARSHTFVEIDHEIILRPFSSLPLNYS